MRCTLLLPGSLVPEEAAAEVLPGLKAPNLAARLQRATRVSEQTVDEVLNGAAHLSWLWSALAGRTAVATAPYALKELGGDPGTQQVWHADPVHLAPARDHLLLLPLDACPLTDSEADALLAAADEACAEHRARLFRHGGAWFLQPETAWAIDAVPLASAAYRPLVHEAPTLPRGADARRWSRLQNEVQILWAQHPVNVARAEEGYATANSLWLHGGGAWQTLPPTRFAQVHADDLSTRGLARAAGARLSAPTNAPGDASLIILEDAFAAARNHDWQDWHTAMQAIDTRIASLPPTLDIVLAGATRVRGFAVARSDRWRFWRHAAPPTWLVEPADQELQTER